jgi:RIO kinase 1
MEFLGEHGWPSPRLKDAQLSENKMRQAYVQTIFIMRHMFRRCKLVHGDLSEYNLLWHNNQVYVIDVSQSVESDHPAALDFLRKDATNINDFFRKFGHLEVMSTRQLFEFVTSVHIQDSIDCESQALDEIMQLVERNSTRLAQQTPQEQMREKHVHQVDEAVFMSQFLPRSLNQLKETDIQKIERGDVEEMYAVAIAGMTTTAAATAAATTTTTTSEMKMTSSFHNYELFQKQQGNSHDNMGEQESSVDDNDEYDDDDNDDESRIHDESFEEQSTDDDELSPHGKKGPPLTAEERQRMEEVKRLERKNNKKAVKEEQREKRLTKMKKKDKKKAIEKTKGKKK